jgi:hypothetical protein
MAAASVTAIRCSHSRHTRPRPPDHAIEPRWLREQYQHRLKGSKTSS